MSARIAAFLLPPRLMREKRFFSLWEKRGYHVTPVNYYEPIPDTRELGEQLWASSSELPGLDIGEDRMLNLLSKFVSSFKAEYAKFPLTGPTFPAQFFLQNKYFMSVDAEILYCMIREFKPRRIIEIGSGNSTYLSAQAIGINQAADSDYQCKLTAIEPYPNPVLRQGFRGLTELIERPVQALPISLFESLEQNDILFIDSSHVVRTGGDVLYEFLEILPRLKKGVLIHVHDIYFPREYPKKWILDQKLFWTEQYLVQAFLAFNNAYEILWAASYLKLKHAEKLRDAFPSYEPNATDPGSLWLRKIQ